MEAGRRVAAETEVGGEICRHGGIDKNGLLMEAEHAFAARQLSSQEPRSLDRGA
jgi:hypothetical protein